MNEAKQFITQIRHLVAADDLTTALHQLQSLLQYSPKLDEVLLQSARFHDIRREIRLGLVDDKTANLTINQVRAGILDLLNEIEAQQRALLVVRQEVERFLVIKENIKGAFKQGLLLYQIPQVMMVEKETRCIVRIALKHSVLFEDLKITDQVKERLLKRISKSMHVEITDASGRNFAVRSTSRVVQIIDLEGEEYTEWRFYVTPLREGQHVLEIKAAVIELVNGEKELRERVFEEDVQIISHDTTLITTAATPFKIAGETLVFARNTDLISSKNTVTGSTISAGGDIHIGDMHTHTINNTVINKVKSSHYRKYALFGFVLLCLFLFLLYWSSLSRPFSLSVSVLEARPIPGLPFKEGAVTLRYGDKTEKLPLSAEAIFKQIPASQKSEPARLTFESSGYRTLDTTFALSENLLLPIRRDNSLSQIFGTVNDARGNPVSGAQIRVQDIVVISNSAGDFTLHIPLEKQGREQRVRAFKEGYQEWDYTSPVIENQAIGIILKSINK